MTDPARERLTVLDADGRPTGVAERGEVYARSLWHASTAVALRSTDGEHGLRAHIHAYQAFCDGPVVHQPAEVAEGGWWTLDELRSRLDPPAYPWVPDGRVVTRRWLGDAVG
ncbi:hypothetical protein [Pseudonocardia sp. NPDC046786]|uniref:hypothetical protein n=1 Tax=Pseudonocardia sp. NPDC046786 TaxID=3155471 RepID=UPI00340D6C4C